MANEDTPAGFEWDPAKARRNDSIPGRPSFRDATTAFVDINRREAVDELNSTDAEVRWRLVGLTARGQLVTVAFAYRRNRIRIISARAATRPKRRAMKRNHPDPPLGIDETLARELAGENLEFDFSRAPRPGRNDLFERAQGQFHEVADEEESDQAEATRLRVEAQHRQRPRPG